MKKEQSGGRRSFYPWKNRRPQPLEVKGRRKEEAQGEVRFYHHMSDGSVRRPEHARHVRRTLGLSPRQYRKALRAERRQS